MAREPARRMSMRTLGLLVGLGLIALGLLPGAVAFFGGGSGSRTFAQLTPGDCVKLSELESGAEPGPVASVELVHEEVPCTSPGTISYTVGVAGPGSLSCPNANYLDYFTTGVDNPENLPREYTACLVPNFTAGICVGEKPLTHTYVVTACGPDALFQVREVHEVDDPARCAPPTRAMEFPHPARTYCLAETD